MSKVGYFVSRQNEKKNISVNPYDQASDFNHVFSSISNNNNNKQIVTTVRNIS